MVARYQAVTGNLSFLVIYRLQMFYSSLEKGNDLKAIKKIGDFTNFVDEMKAEGRLDYSQAKYLIHESTIHLKDRI